MEESGIIASLGGRKFIFAILLVLMGFVLVLTGKVDPEAFLNFCKVVGGGYMVGNVASFGVSKVK